MPTTPTAPIRTGRGTRSVHRLGLRTGVTAVAIGVAVQVPAALRMARAERSMTGGHVRMVMSGSAMTIGMLLATVGLVVAGWAVFADARRALAEPAGRTMREAASDATPGGPAANELAAGGPVSDEVASTAGLASIQHERFRPIYLLTCVALTVALVIDVMKPLTLAFVLPGIREEYGMSLDAVSSLPMVALTGTAVGSIVWGVLGDRCGRRPVLLLATLIFIATSACGAMPSFGWNLLMCFLMGASAGGLLPLVFTLVAELTPASHRSWVGVSIGSVGGLGGYLAASNAARLLEPHYTWRMLWLIGLPTGLVLLALSPLIPESPGFLLRSGYPDRAEAILRRYGSRFVYTGRAEAPATGHGGLSGVVAVLRRYPLVTGLIMVLGIVWGVVNFGFMLLLPGQLRDAGMTGGTASGLLANSALYSAPALVVVVLLYAGWNARAALALFIALMAVSLAGVGYWTVSHGATWLATTCIGMLVVSLTAVNATLLPYSAEVYPAAVRATGTGLAAGATKLGGVLGPSLVLLLIRLGGARAAVPALVLAVAGAVAALLLIRWGPCFGRTSRRDQQPGIPVQERAT